MYEMKAPLSGTIHLKRFDADEMYVKVGDKVKKGDIICVIDAMKMMNAIESDYDGVIEKIICEDNTLINANEVILVLKVDNNE